MCVCLLACLAVHRDSVDKQKKEGNDMEQMDLSVKWTQVTRVCTGSTRWATEAFPQKKLDYTYTHSTSHVVAPNPCSLHLIFGQNSLLFSLLNPFSPTIISTPVMSWYIGFPSFLLQFKHLRFTSGWWFRHLHHKTRLMFGKSQPRNIMKRFLLRKI